MNASDVERLQSIFHHVSSIEQQKVVTAKRGPCVSKMVVPRTCIIVNRLPYHACFDYLLGHKIVTNPLTTNKVRSALSISLHSPFQPILLCLLTVALPLFLVLPKVTFDL